MIILYIRNIVVIRINVYFFMSTAGFTKYGGSPGRQNEAYLFAIFFTTIFSLYILDKKFLVVKFEKINVIN